MLKKLLSIGHTIARTVSRNNTATFIIALALTFLPAQRAYSETAYDLFADGPEMTISIGDDDAAVTLVQYSSLFCGHCIEFHQTIFQDLVRDYVAAGKLRIEFRPFLISADSREVAASMLPYCVEPDRRIQVLQNLIDTQEQWARGDAPLPVLHSASGLSVEDFNTCLRDQGKLDILTNIRESGANRFSVHFTPTLFVNGKPLLSDAASGHYVEDGVLKQGVPDSGSSAKIVRLPENSRARVIKEIEAALN